VTSAPFVQARAASLSCQTVPKDDDDDVVVVKNGIFRKNDVNPSSMLDAAEVVIPKKDDVATTVVSANERE
jgi:hypothetical protein